MTRGWLAIAAVAILLLAAAGALFAPDPVDADVPAHLSRAVEDGRASILDHLDLVEPGSRLVLTDLRCREDGGVLLRFTNRWLWLVERAYYTSSDGAPSGPGDFGGGVIDGPTDAEIDAWLAGADEVDCSAARGQTPKWCAIGYVLASLSANWAGVWTGASAMSDSRWASPLTRTASTFAARAIR